MELVKDIYFNTDKLIENTKVKVSYTGKFYQGNNEKVYLHYGYGKDWNNVNELEMKKTDLGYQAELNLLSGDTLNFCFKNQNNEWDNNFGQNYVFNIQKKSNNVVNTNKENAFTIFGKTFGNKNENQSSSNVFWNSKDSVQSNPQTNIVNTSTVVTNVTNNGTPNSVDAFIENKSDSVLVNTNGVEFQFNSNLQTPTDTNDFKVITPSFKKDVVNTPFAKVNENSNNVLGGTSNISNAGNSNQFQNFGTPISNGVDRKLSTSTNIINPVNSVTETAIVAVPTGFNYWTMKIKETVCKFFAYVPKLISGNYRRNVSNEKK